LDVCYVHISVGIIRLKTIHEANFIYRDFHSENIIIIEISRLQNLVLGLSQLANNSSLNNELYLWSNTLPYKKFAYGKSTEIVLKMYVWYGKCTPLVRVGTELCNFPYLFRM
jgi:hypothetical protein